jgi:general stress protein YciG
MAEEKRPKQRRGFACMSKERVQEIAAIGGKRAHELGVAYTWNSRTATKAGAKGGRVRRRSEPA